MLRKPSLPSVTLSRYDAVLLVIPTGFVVSLFLWAVFGLSAQFAAIAGSTIGLAALVDGLFLHPPIDPQLSDEGVVEAEGNVDDFAPSD